ncbi:hypothetical protein M5J20_07810 [Corynebacterium sp. TA-R-1]|uniref:Uncharacterized protein n=1 Tax=Corynebacterium stercoris TaxID=2943490 RepID=A0ABT1G239_9CORY|nr:hypothetical protein [Corynebacterium stercoris]MCP1388092.1 hypothetical protein [Corynebacterium stercoris]
MQPVLIARDLVANEGDTPVTLEVYDGLTIVQTKRESGGSTLSMALAGRYRPHSGTVEGPGFKGIALAGVTLIDSLERQVPSREAIREEVVWALPFFSRTPRRQNIMEHKFVEPWLEPLQLTNFDPDRTPGELGVLERFRLRILLALISRPNAELLIVDDIDQIKKMSLRSELLADLENVAKHVPVLVTTVNEEL